MRIVAASRRSSLTSNSLVIDFAFSDSGVAVQMVGRPISVGITASIPLVSAKGEMPIGFQAVVLYAQSTPGSSSTHFPLAESNCFFKAVNMVLLEASAWPLLCRYRGVEYKFFIFNS